MTEDQLVRIICEKVRLGEYYGMDNEISLDVPAESWLKRDKTIKVKVFKNHIVISGERIEHPLCEDIFTMIKG